MEREQFEEEEAARLTLWGMRSRDSRGRVYPDAEHAFRMSFQRDRDRIIHSTAFRRLEYKTQVFVNHEGDYYRTRLTHSMEAAQVSRTIAAALRVNQDLAETVALAHDLGHTPFGHAGERALDKEMEPYGGFEHNAQSLRIVDVLEERYPDFRGLNLTFEVREGIVKHSPPYNKALAAEFDPGKAPCIEAQIVDYADEIAYNVHDIDDGLKSGLLTPQQLEGVSLWRENFDRIRALYPSAGFRVWRYQVLRTLIEDFVNDLIAAVRRRVEELHIETVQDVRDVGRPIATFGEEMEARRIELKDFLMENLYRHYRVMRMAVKAQKVVRDLFRAYMEEPAQLPPHVVARGRAGEGQARIVADYIAGMTDRFAVEEWKKLFDPSERV